MALFTIGFLLNFEQCSTIYTRTARSFYLAISQPGIPVDSNIN